MTTPAPGPAPHLVITVGRQATHRPAEGRCRPGDRYRPLTDPDEAAAVLDEELARLPTGWRIRVVGTERETGIVRAAALARGALEEEITVLTARGDGSRRVHCGHCHHRFDVEAAVGDAIGCPGCGTPLRIAAHHSPTHGAFLGAPTV